MEMDKLGVVTTFVHNIVVYNIPLLYGTVGEIVVEKSGSLNLGVEGIMAVGAIFGYIVGCYANSLAQSILVVGIGVRFFSYWEEQEHGTLLDKIGKLGQDEPKEEREDEGIH